MFVGIDRNEVKKYVSPNDPDQVNPTVFFISPLQTEVRNKIEEVTTSVEISSKNPGDRIKTNISTGKRHDLIIKYGLKDIQNFGDSKGNLVKVDIIPTVLCGKPMEGVSDSIISMLSSNLKSEIAEVIWDENNLPDAAAKN